VDSSQVKIEAIKAPSPGWYVSAMERLVYVVQDLSLARDIDSIANIVRKAARDLTGADGATFIMREGDKCHYVSEDAISPLWAGQRFPMKSCISGWVMLSGVPAVIEDIYLDQRIPVEAYRPTFVKSLVMVPVNDAAPLAAIGNYWATKRMPTSEELAILQALANVVSVSIENVNLYGELQKKIKALEESNHELSRFAWIAAHDLKAPLRAISYLSQRVEKDMADKFDEASREHSLIIRQRIGRMEKLLDDVLEYAHTERKTQEEGAEMADGATIADDVLGLVDVPENFEVRFTKSFGNLRAARFPIQRVLCNLISNAIHHHHQIEGIVEIDCKETDTQYIITVQDDGPGIEQEYHQLIFEMFQTLNPRDVKEGSGMGLAFVKKIVQTHGGEISLDSRRGRGSIFKVTWPKRLKGVEYGRS
jgi:signal transduction histidine kinase